MTNTSVKDVSSILTNLAPAAGSGAKNVTGGNFQAVWNNQSGKEPSGSQGTESRAAVKKAPGDSLKARDAHRVRTEKQEPVEENGEVRELSEDELMAAMEVLGPAAAELMEQIADTLGVTVEELSAAMEELGMEQLDVLDPRALGELILKVGGAQDSSALVTNEELYGSYRELMGELDTVLQECGRELQLDPEQVKELAQQLQELPAQDGEQQKVQPQEEILILPEAPEEPAGDIRIIPEKTSAEEPADQNQKAVQEPEQAMVQEETPTQVWNRENAGEQAGAGDEKGGRHRESREDQNLNLFAQNLRAEQFQPQLQRSEVLSASQWDTSTQDIMRQVMDYMRINLKPELTNLEMQLHPASLGTLQVQVASKGGVITANFITQNEAVKSALESQMIQLKESFEEQGVKVEAIEVTVQSHAFERNLEQGRGSGNQSREPERKARTRKIDLNDPLSVEEMDQEDVLAAEIMTASGSTVDYTV
ncbi:MAG: flagellar hook-length control protein FliK [Acetatifactor sp.]|nr:flagellar hook-length control protein FliK [Acetatifactor sp.]